jgi:hypothetical protein
MLYVINRVLMIELLFTSIIIAKKFFLDFLVGTLFDIEIYYNL